MVAQHLTCALERRTGLQEQDTRAISSKHRQECQTDYYAAEAEPSRSQTVCWRCRNVVMHLWHSETCRGHAARPPGRLPGRWGPANRAGCRPRAMPPAHVLSVPKPTLLHGEEDAESVQKQQAC